MTNNNNNKDSTNTWKLNPFSLFCDPYAQQQQGDESDDEDQNSNSRSVDNVDGNALSFRRGISPKKASSSSTLQQQQQPLQGTSASSSGRNIISKSRELDLSATTTETTTEETNKPNIQNNKRTSKVQGLIQRFEKGGPEPTSSSATNNIRKRVSNNQNSNSGNAWLFIRLLYVVSITCSVVMMSSACIDIIKISEYCDTDHTTMMTKRLCSSIHWIDSLFVETTTTTTTTKTATQPSDTTIDPASIIKENDDYVNEGKDNDENDPIVTM